MALRNILTKEEPRLRKKSREVTSFDDKLHCLIDDMIETLETQDGVGLAAPQVGVLKRVVIVIETNVGEDEDDIVLELVNPEIIEFSGEQEGGEGCLSFPGEFGIVKRPDTVRIKAQDRYGDYYEYEGTGLTARCFCHEIDHLNGVLFPDVCERMLSNDEIEKLGETEE